MMRIKINERGWFNKSYAAFTVEITPPDLANAFRRNTTEDSLGSKVFYISEPVATNINVTKFANGVSDEKYSYGKFTLKKSEDIKCLFLKFQLGICTWLG